MKLSLDFCRTLHHVELELGKINFFFGENGAGKSSLCSMVNALLTGKIDKTIVSDGALASARIELALDDISLALEVPSVGASSYRYKNHPTSKASFYSVLWGAQNPFDVGFLSITDLLSQPTTKKIDILYNLSGGSIGWEEFNNTINRELRKRGFQTVFDISTYIPEDDRAKITASILDTVLESLKLQKKNLERSLEQDFKQLEKPIDLVWSEQDQKRMEELRVSTTSVIERKNQLELRIKEAQNELDRNQSLLETTIQKQQKANSNRATIEKDGIALRGDVERCKLELTQLPSEEKAAPDLLKERDRLTEEVSQLKAKGTQLKDKRNELRELLATYQKVDACPIGLSCPHIAGKDKLAGPIGEVQKKINAISQEIETVKNSVHLATEQWTDAGRRHTNATLREKLAGDLKLTETKQQNLRSQYVKADEEVKALEQQFNEANKLVSDRKLLVNNLKAELQTTGKDDEPKLQELAKLRAQYERYLPFRHEAEQILIKKDLKNKTEANLLTVKNAIGIFPEVKATIVDNKIVEIIGKINAHLAKIAPYVGKIIFKNTDVDTFPNSFEKLSTSEKFRVNVFISHVINTIFGNNLVFVVDGIDILDDKNRILFLKEIIAIAQHYKTVILTASTNSGKNVATLPICDKTAFPQFDVFEIERHGAISTIVRRSHG